ncbi:9429_t:CDS:2, partial [Entrophospora sp. SA101]
GEEHMSEQVSEYSDGEYEKKEDSDDGEIVTIRKIHLTNLYNLLYLSLQSQNYCRANRIVEILLRKPYCNNALFNGYAGLLTFALLGQLEKSDQDNDVDGGNENGQSEPIDNEKIRYYDLCKRSFEKALDLDITNDMFLVYYVK